MDITNFAGERRGTLLSWYCYNKSKVKTPSLKVFKIHVCPAKERVPFLSPARYSGSMTLEGCLVLPLFLFFMMSIILSIEVVRFQSDMQEALHKIGNENAFLGYQVKYQNMSTQDTCSGITSYLGKQLYPYLCVSDGEAGLVIQDLSTVEQDGTIYLKAKYQIKSFISWLSIGDVYFEDTFYSHAWTGFSPNQLDTKLKDDEIFVYITKTGSKYHLSYDCTYLRIPIQSINASQLSTIRGASGQKYYACERCHPAKEGMVYITTDGNRYHGQADCSSLIRTVFVIPLSKATGYGPCSKCAN